MSAQHVAVHVDAEAAPDTVWSLLSDVSTWPSWSSFDEAAYERPGHPAPHGLGAVRLMRVGRLRSRETVLVFEPQSRLSYDYAGPLPLRDYRADVLLTPTATGTRISWSATFRTPRVLPAAVAKALVRRVLSDVAGQLAAAAGRHRLPGAPQSRP